MSYNNHNNSEEYKIMENVKMFLFSRWIATCYADEHLDDKKRHTSDEGFDKNTAMSALNRVSGYWYKEQLKHFNNTIYPNYIKNGTVDSTIKFLSDLKL